jgi:hypothetical protein
MTDHTVKDEKSLIHLAYCTGPAQLAYLISSLEIFGIRPNDCTLILNPGVASDDVRRYMLKICNELKMNVTDLAKYPQHKTADTLYRVWEKLLAQMDNWSPEGLLTTFFEAFYSVWNNVPRSQLPSAYVAHTPMLHTSAGQWCDATRNLKIIQIIRHPAAYLASELGRNRNKLPPENPASMRGLGRLKQRFLAYGGLTEAKRSQREKACIGWQIRHFLDRWVQAVNISLANEKQLGERYLTVRYEDIVERTLQTMEAVTQFLGIS